MKEKIEQLRAKKAQALLGGGTKRIEAQHEKGKLTADLPSGCLRVRRSRPYLERSGVSWAEFQDKHNRRILDV